MKSHGKPPQLPKLQKVSHAIRGDLGAFWAALPPPASLEPGLYTYRTPLPGGSKRIHLRVEEDGTGVLFVDVTHVVHLNPTAAEMAKLALEGVPLEAARPRLRRRFWGANGAQLSKELVQIYDMIDRVRDSGHGCPTCAQINVVF